MPPIPVAPARSNGVTAPTVHTRIRRPCESRWICTASSSTCSTITPASRNSDLWREGIPTIASCSTNTLVYTDFEVSVRFSPASPLTTSQLQNPKFHFPGLWTRRLLVDANLPQQFEVAQHLSRAQHHRRQRIVGDGDRQSSFLAYTLIQIFQQRAAARQHDSAIAYVGGKIGRCPLQRDTNGIQDGRNAL